MFNSFIAIAWAFVVVGWIGIISSLICTVKLRRFSAAIVLGYMSVASCFVGAILAVIALQYTGR